MTPKDDEYQPSSLSFFSFPKVVVSVLLRGLSAEIQKNAPRRSSSRSLSGLRYDRELWISSAVSLIVVGCGKTGLSVGAVQLHKIVIAGDGFE